MLDRRQKLVDSAVAERVVADRAVVPDGAEVDKRATAGFADSLDQPL